MSLGTVGQAAGLFAVTNIDDIRARLLPAVLRPSLHDMCPLCRDRGHPSGHDQAATMY